MPGFAFSILYFKSPDQNRFCLRGFLSSANRTVDDATILEEGKETSGFWNAIDGEEEYYSAQRRDVRYSTVYLTRIK